MKNITKAIQSSVPSPLDLPGDHTESKGEEEVSNFFELAPYYYALQDRWVDPVDHEVARMIPAELSREANAMPIGRVGRRIFVASVDPSSEKTKELLTRVSGDHVLVKAEPADLMLAQDRVYGVPTGLADQTLGGILLREQKIGAAELAEALRQQSATGGKIGSLLTAANLVTHWDIAEGIARQKGLPLIDLLHDDQSGGGSDVNLLKQCEVLPEAFWFRHLVVPLAVEPDAVTAAMADPDDTEAIRQLEAAFGRRVRIMVTGYRDAIHALRRRYRDAHEERSRFELMNTQPENSACRQVTKGQVLAAIAGATVLAAGFLWNWVVMGTIVNTILQLFYGINAVFRLWMIHRASDAPLEDMITGEDLDKMPLDSLPSYTVLVPLYKEAAVLPTLSKAMTDLIYPRDRLDVKFLLEEDDEETIKAARAANLPSYVDLVIVPASEPRTKPKACNFGLLQARGEYIVIFDAEDIPEPDQLLKAVHVFRSGDGKLACVQAKLSYFNERQNFLTRWFTSEYAMWFDLFLPALFSTRMPIPLGGSSNHFRTDILVQMGAWDPHNVTEDADLGVRLHKQGYRTTVMNSTTYEEANSDFVNWVRQRSRWVKGYIQTWLVHMRSPVKLAKELGWSGSFGFQMMIGGTPFMFLFNPVLWALVVIWFVFGPNASAKILPSWVYYLAALNFVMGNFMFLYANVTGLARRARWSLIPFALLTPIYWVFMSLGAWKGAIQLITRPSYWEKTIHGLSPAAHPAPKESAETFG